MVLEIPALVAAVVVPPTIEAAKNAVNPVSSRIGYLFRHKKYVDDLDTKMHDFLLKLQNDVEEKVSLALANGHQIHKVVEHWLKEVNKIKIEVTDLIDEARQIQRSFQGWASSRYQIGKSARKKHVIVDELLTEGRGFRSISNPPSITPLLPLPTHFIDFDSRKRTKSDLIQALTNDNLVGVHGMGGMGKRILVYKVCEEVEKSKLFDKIVLVKVSENLSYTDIQKQIAEGLGLTFTVTTESLRAAYLLARLNQEKKIIVILEDAWDTLKLERVGIKVTKGCKVLITSRDVRVCRSMGSNNNIEVKKLSNKDSFELFTKIVGDIGTDVKRINISKEIVNKCGGLPLAIYTIAEKLEGKSNGIWEAVISLLKSSEYEDMATVNKSIKRSYKFLKKNSQLCFLLCALFPEDHKISLEKLKGYAIGEGLLGDDETWALAENKLDLIMDKLKSSGLLVNDNDSRYVTMHAIFRDAAISIAREDGSNSIIRAGLNLTRWPTIETKSSLRISLMGNNVRNVPDTPKCSELVTLSLARNKYFSAIPDRFFEDMERLGTLDLSETSISLFPKSLSSLGSSLRALYLDDCKITNICSIRNLKALEVLSLKRTGISKLPEEVKLPNLKITFYN